jgi:hypothetical protein
MAGLGSAPIDIDLANMDLNINIEQDQLNNAHASQISKEKKKELILDKIVVEDMDIHADEISNKQPQISRLRDIEIDLFVLFS